MESPHVDYKSQIFLIGKEVDLGESTHPISWYQDPGGFNSSMVNDTRELYFQNKAVTTDPLLGDVHFYTFTNPEQRQFNSSGQKI